MSEKTLSQYLDGELPASAQERVRGHVETCDRCREALERMRSLDEAIRGGVQPVSESPDLAARVTGELSRRGAFFKARVRAGKGRVFGESLVSMRLMAALAAAAGIVMLVGAGLDQATRREWARRTEPVLADAERVLVRLVVADRVEESGRLAWARDEARKLLLSERLAEVRSGAQSAWAGDLARLENTFMLLARGDPLPEDLAAQLGDGQLLQQAVRLRQNLPRGG